MPTISTSHRGASLLSWIVFITGWFLLFYKLQAPLVLPSPVEVGRVFLQLLLDRETYPVLFHSLVRLILAFTITLFTGSAIGLASGLSPRMKSFFRLGLGLLKTTPVLAVVILAIIWLPSYWVPVFVALLVMIPIMEGSLRQGIRQIDPKLVEMTRLFQVPLRQQIGKLYIPHLKPYVLTGSLASLGIGFKAVIAAEVLSSPVYGIGARLSTHKALLETDYVIAWTLWAVLISLSLDILLTRRKKDSP